MKKYVVILLISLLLLSSCNSTRSASTPEREREESEAVMTLSRDMVSHIKTGLLKAEDISSALPESYTAYKDYLPSYDEIAARYLASVISILEEDFVSIFTESFLNVSSSLVSSPRKYLMGEMLLLDAESASRTYISLSFGNLMDKRKDELDNAFNESSTNFEMVKKAYDNLSKIGITENLSPAGEIERNSLITLVLDKYYSILEEEEINLRTNPLYGESSYRLFWENYQ